MTSNSSARAPTLLVKKPEDSCRLCMDYHALNNVTVGTRGPLPLITELREIVNMAKVSTKLEHKNGYHLVRMPEEDEEKSALCTRFKLYHLRAMPLGQCHAPATF